jgi:hypothetical protein
MRIQELMSKAKPAGMADQLYVPRPQQLAENSLKPQARLWTSTAVKTARGYSSAWVRWARNEMPGWIGAQGYLFQVSAGARILTINSDRAAMRVAQLYGQDIQDPVELFRHMPWDQIQQHYDGVHYVPQRRDLYMGSWDVESTAWFSTGVLESLGEVEIDRS